MIKNVSSRIRMCIPALFRSGISTQKPRLFFACALLLLLALGGLSRWVNPWLEYQASVFEHFEYWRLITANIVHLNTFHALMNIAALVLAVFMFHPIVNLTHWLWVFIPLCLSVTVGIYCFDPHVYAYVGLSGVLYGLWVFGALLSVRQTPMTSLAVAGILMFALNEQQASNFDAAYLHDWINGKVIVNAHLYGFIGGLFCGGASLIWSLIRRGEAQ